MNQINLDKLLQLAPAGKADTATLKLMVAQVYQGQVQQLSSGQFRLQLPSTQGPLQINLPSTVSRALQQLVPQFSQIGALQQRLAVLVQFQPQNDGRILLSLTSAGAPSTIALQPSQIRQLLFAVYSSLTSVTPSQSKSRDAVTALVTAQLQNQNAGSAIQLPRVAPLAVSAQMQSSLAHLLSSSQSNQLTVQLELSNTENIVSANVLLPGKAPQQGSSGILGRPQQIALLQNLVKLFNQQHLNTSDSARLPLSELKQLIATKVPSGLTHILQLQPKGSQFQLQLIPQKSSLALMVNSEEFNRPLQFVSNVQQASAPPVGAASGNLSQQVLQQAWRHLLPLLPQRPDSLASLPELPESVQQILQLIRSSQPDSSKIMSVKQLIPQLQSVLQFQPLQPNASLQTAGGTLAVAIQLLLGHLLQKPQPATNQPGNQKLLQLVQSLEPAQASSLLRQLASQSSVLQQSQLATLDSNSTAQQHLLLQLPLQQGEQSVLSQIQLEQREADGKQQGEKQTQWQLTMKFDLQHLGPLLVVAKLQEQQLQLQFYTEQALAKQLTDKFLPILKDRCTMQGLEVNQADCMLGKIPDSLLPRANSLLAIKA